MRGHARNLRLSIASTVVATLQACALPSTLNGTPTKELSESQRDAAKAALEDIYAVPNPAGHQSGPLEKGKLGKYMSIDTAFESLVELARSVPEFAESNGTLEGELVLMGRDLASDQSAIRAMRERLATPAQELTDISEVPNWHAPQKYRAAVIIHAYGLGWDEAATLTPEQKSDQRLAWQMVLLMPALVNTSGTDGDVAYEIAFDALVRLDDPAAVPVITERMRLDLEQFGWSTPISPSTACLMLEKLVIADGSVSADDLRNLLDFMGHVGAAAPFEHGPDRFLDDLQNRVAYGDRLLPIRVPEFVWRSKSGEQASLQVDLSDEERVSLYQAWATAVENHSREGLSELQSQYLDDLKAAAHTRIPG